MTKVEYAEQTLYDSLLDAIHGIYFVGVGKQISNEIVLVVYLETESEPVLPAEWEGFRVVTKSLYAMIS